MSAFGGLIFTNVGRNLQAKAQSGTQLNFTRIAIGDGDLSGTAIADLTVLKHQVKSCNITKLKPMTGGKAVVGTSFSNSDIVTGFYWKELGIFAQDPDLGEILYCYGNAGANAEYIPAGGGPDIVEKSIDAVTIVGNASGITATIDSSLVYVTTQDFNGHVNNNVIHATQTDRDTWNAKETPAGAQAKVDAAIAALLSGAPGALDTLNELAAALGDDPNFATTIINSLATKADSSTVNAHLAENATLVDSVNTNAYVFSTGQNITLEDKKLYTFMCVNASTGNITIKVDNGAVLPLKNFSTGTQLGSGKVKANQLFQAWYSSSGSCFFLRASAVGNVTADKVLAPYTFSSDDVIEGTGTIPSKGVQTYTPGTTDQTIAANQYLSGAQTIKGDANLVAANILLDKSIYGVTGTAAPKEDIITYLSVLNTVKSSYGSFIGLTSDGLWFRPSGNPAGSCCLVNSSGSLVKTVTITGYLNGVTDKELLSASGTTVYAYDHNGTLLRSMTIPQFYTSSTTSMQTSSRNRMYGVKYDGTWYYLVGYDMSGTLIFTGNAGNNSFFGLKGTPNGCIYSTSNVQTDNISTCTEAGVVISGYREFTTKFF